jgi:hypothetical protein
MAIDSGFISVRQGRAPPDDLSSHGSDDSQLAGLDAESFGFVALRRSGALAANLEQLEAERFDLGEHAVKRRLVRQRSGQYGVASLRLRVQARERLEERRVQESANADLVARGSRRLRHAPSIAAKRMTAHRPDRMSEP